MERSQVITNAADAIEEGGGSGPWGSTWRVLTPHMRARGGTLGVAQNRLEEGQVGCPFHFHHREDEVFFVLSGRGVLRYGEDRWEVGPGDCVSCPAGTGTAHQLANPYPEPLVYLSIGPHDPHEICEYPDTGKVFVRSLKAVGRLTREEYMAGEPEPPLILAR